jgi:hypothetical protein
VRNNLSIERQFKELRHKNLHFTFGELCYNIEVPLVCSRSLWKPKTEQPNEVTFYSDGGKEEGGMGAAVAISKQTGRNYPFSFQTCISSKMAENEALELASRTGHFDKSLILSIESWKTCKPCSPRATKYDLGMCLVVLVKWSNGRMISQLSNILMYLGMNKWISYAQRSSKKLRLMERNSNFL